MAEDLSLLFRLRADNAQAKSTLAETQAAVASLRTSFGSDMNQMQVASSRALGQIQNQLNTVVSRIPGGNAFISLTEGLKGVASQSERVSPALTRFNKSVDELSKTTGKSSSEMVRFLGEFVKLPNAMDRSILGYAKFGSKFDELRPKLEQAGTQLAQVAAEATAAGSSMAAMAGPIGLAVAGIIASTVAVGLLGKALFDLAQSSAEVEGKMFDLSQQTGVAVETLSALEVLAKTTGGDIGNLTQSLVAFQRNLESAQDPTSKQAELFKKLGVEANNTEDALRQTFAALARLPEGFSQTNQAAELFGARGGKQVLAILKESKGDLDGAIERFRDLGILISGDTAKAADEFNDELAIVQFQLRATAAIIGREVIPHILEALKDLSVVLRDNRDLIDAVATAAGVIIQLFTVPLKGAILSVDAAWLGAKTTLLAIQSAYEAIALAAQIIARYPILPSTKGTPATAATATAEEETEEEKKKKKPRFESQARITRDLLSQLQAQRDLLATQEAFFEQEKTLAADRLATAQQEFREGQRTRQQNLGDVIAHNQALRDADLGKLVHKRDLLVTQAALAKDDLTKQQEFNAQIIELDQKVDERRAQFDRESAELRSKVRQQELDDEAAHQESLLSLATKFDAARIASIEAKVREGKQEALEGDAEIAAIENAALDREQAFLVRKLETIGREPSARRAVALEIKAIEADRTALLQEQEDRRQEIIRRSGETQRQIILGNLDTQLRIEQIRGASLIAAIQSLAVLRVKTEEDAAKQILAIQLRLIDAEIAALEIRRKGTGSISDSAERLRVEADLNNQLSILRSQRVAIEVQGQREVDAARQDDLDNARDHADDLRKIQERITDIERDTAKETIELMRLNFASRKDIIRAESDLEIKRAEDRHRRNQDDIRREQTANDERLAGLQGFLRALDATGGREIEIYARSLKARIDFLTQQGQLSAQEQQELAQHQAILAAIQGRISLQSYARTIQARVTALERQKSLNAEEQIELQSHHAILDGLREQEANSLQVSTLQARIEVLQQQKTLNVEEQIELEAHQAELKRIRESGDLAGVIEKRIAVLTQQGQLNAREQDELAQHIATLKAIREGDSFETVIRARIEFLERQGQLNAREQEELTRHRAIVKALEDRSQNYKDAIQRRIEFLQKQKELNAEEKAELERHIAEQETIERRRRVDERNADPLGRLELDSDSLEEFAATIEDSIVPLGEILTKTFLQVADAIGQTVKNWVLLGTTGPAVMRKILATALASIAAEAAVNAIKELALGFAMLFLNPAEAGAHFTAAALWASIAGVSAIVGRGVAGDLFKPQTAGGHGGTEVGHTRPGESTPIEATRGTAPREELHIFVHGEPGPGFNDAIINTAVRDVQRNGPMRDLIIHTAGGS